MRVANGQWRPTRRPPAANPGGRLHGIPVTVKDAIATKGIRSTGGAEALFHHVPQHDAQVVTAIKDAGRDRVRQDQRAAVVGRLPVVQRHVRHDQQPVGSQPRAGRFIRRCRGRGRVRHDELRDRHRHRWLGASAVRVLRGLRAQAVVRCRADVGLSRRAQRRSHRERRQCLRPDRPQCRRPRTVARRAGRADVGSRSRMAARTTAPRHQRVAIAAHRRVVRRAVAADGLRDDQRCSMVSPMHSSRLVAPSTGGSVPTSTSPSRGSRARG